MDLNKSVFSHKHIRYVIWGGVCFLLAIYGIKNELSFVDVFMQNTKKENFSSCDNNYYVDNATYISLVNNINPKGIKDTLQNFSLTQTPRAEQFVIAISKLYGVHVTQDINFAVDIFDHLASGEQTLPYYVPSRLEAAIIREVCSETSAKNALYTDFKIAAEFGDVKAAYFKYLYDIGVFGKDRTEAIEELASFPYQSFYPAMLEIYFQLYFHQEWSPALSEQLISTDIFQKCSHVLFYLHSVNPYISAEDSVLRLDFINKVKPDLFASCELN